MVTGERVAFWRKRGPYRRGALCNVGPGKGDEGMLRDGVRLGKISGKGGKKFL